MSNPKRDVHVLPHPKGGWQVRREGAKRAWKRYATKEEAVHVGLRLAMRFKVELVIHNLDGTISDSDSYGNDPNPPKDKRF